MGPPTNAGLATAHNTFISFTCFIISIAVRLQIPKLPLSFFLFHGFSEQMNENCTDRVKDLISKKNLPSNPNSNDIKIVRAHRLGRFNGGADKPRPIIVKFREYSDKMDVFTNKTHLKNTPFVVLEDFSANTNSQRDFLQDSIKDAKANLGEKMNAGFLRYKTLIIKSDRGTFHRFSGNYIDENPRNWWRKVLGSEEEETQHFTRRVGNQSLLGNAAVGGVIPHHRRTT